MSTRIYHNPRCSKSRQTLEILTERGETPQIIKYLETPPNADELRELLDMLGIAPRDLMRKGEPEYKSQGLDDESLDDATLIEAMVKTPKLIERPIVVKKGHAALVRPPERVVDIL